MNLSGRSPNFSLAAQVEIWTDIRIDNNQNVIYNFDVALIGSEANIAHKQIKVYYFIKTRYLRKTYNRSL
ncbi:MAG: hypothetical protein DRR08_01785 [Candidatus Parabeggiatoa sp. nov. 2]|nr:MAG: hypothetical protein B6247_04610 [Beggiatoa sp. 4572_84]RKZ64014.1 MAG: hypothetical protein DRR08_01785 [Gammaproteobacteria bacterium]